MQTIVNHVDVKSVLTKSNLPVSDYSVNPYVGCAHACKYCYASFMKRFTGHPEPWGTFVDIKHWPDIKNPKRYAGKELFLGSVTDPLSAIGRNRVPHPRAFGANAGQRLQSEHCHEIRFGASGFGFD